MSSLDKVTDAWMKNAAEAAERWEKRASERAEIQAKLDAEGPGAADAPDFVEAYRNRASGRRAERALHPTPLPDDIRVERIMGIDNRIRFPETVEERDAGRPVARIVTLPQSGRPAEGFGSGFMITPRLLMTNHHVIATVREARGIGANFDHGFTRGGGVTPGEIFDLLPDTFFASDKALDYAVVAVGDRSLSGKALDAYGHHPLIERTGKILIGKPINIIQHPDGGPKMYANKDNDVIDRLEDFLHYRTDTKPGSSGSPCFNDFWEVVALHHSGVPAMANGRILNKDNKPWTRAQGVDAVQWVANEGVRISRILADLRSRSFSDPQQAALRDEIFALGVSADESGDAVSLPPAVATVTAGPARPAPSVGSGEMAQTIVHVHGPANVYTGTVTQTASATAEQPLPSPAAQESGLGAEAAIRFDPHYGRRRGYQSTFLDGFDIPLPRVQPARAGEIVTDRHGNPQILDYHHFSLVMNRVWLLQMWSAVNVDYSPEVRWDLERSDFGSDKWIHDPRLSEALQIDNEELYAPAKKFDRGHVVRRDDNVWGVTREEVEFANSDTFHWTNCTPQHENFNRSSLSGVWGRLENHIKNQASAVGGKLILFSGPVLDIERAIPHDFGGGLFRVPLDFWKVAVVVEPPAGRRARKLRAYGFVLEQKKAIDTKGLEKLPVEERFDVGDCEAQQRSLKAVEKRTGLVFADIVREADVMLEAADDAVVALESLDDLKLQP